MFRSLKIVYNNKKYLTNKCYRYNNLEVQCNNKNICYNTRVKEPCKININFKYWSPCLQTPALN